MANPPAHYTANAQVDCNDNDQTVSANQTYYSDADGDGLGTPNGAKQFCAIAPPTNFVANSNDLNDNDFDNDGVSPPADCNDRDAAVSIYKIYYADLDGDGKGSGIGEKKCLATPPMGYVANNTDQYPNDFDNDGVSPPADCNDRDATVSKNQLYYRDNDGDGVGNGIAESFCLANPPAHYTANAQVDCNDNDQTVSANQTYYLDADGDGLGSKTSISTCSANPPARYVRAGGTDRNDNDYDNDGFPANKDCNDRNPRYHRILIYYLDKDGDGLGNPRASKKFCVPPAGYVSNHRDNDDSRRR